MRKASQSVCRMLEEAGQDDERLYCTIGLETVQTRSPRSLARSSSCPEYQSRPQRASVAIICPAIRPPSARIVTSKTLWT